MFRQFRHPVVAFLSVATFLNAAPSFAAWTDNVSYGGNMPTDIYVPDGAELPPVVVTLHYCSGNKGNAHPWLESYAEMYGFIVITPQAGGNCFDATPARSGERAEVVAMVEYAISEYGGDDSRVFATGASSGACMTQALLAAYPEVFSAGSALAGVPAGAWTGGNAYGWSTPAQSDEQWGDEVRQVNPDYSGPWPRFQLWHGMGDTTLTYSQNYPAQVAQWTNVWGVGEADGTNEMIQPMGANDTWDRTSYTDSSGVVVVEANSGPGSVPHDLTGRGLWRDVVRFFGLDMAVAPTTTTGMGGSTGTDTGSGAGGASTTSAATTASSVATSSGTTSAATSATVAGVTGSTSGSVTTGATAQATSAATTAATSATSSPAGSSNTTVASAVTGPAASTTGSGTTSAPTATESSDDGGCSCRTAAEKTPGDAAWSLLGLGVLGLLRQRRQRRA